MLNISGFFLFLALSALICRILPSRGWKNIFLLICSIFFSSLISISYTVYFFLNIILVYSAASLISKDYKRKRLLLKSVLIWLIGNLCFFKYTNLLLDALFKTKGKFLQFPWIDFSNILLPLGFSYVTFRLIHYIVDAYRNVMPKSSFAEFALYILFFPTFLAGPVERFQRFYPQGREAKNPDITNVNYGLFRIICGLIRKILIADKLKIIVMPVLLSPHSYNKALVISAIYGLAVQIYMDFAGYTDIAIGASRLFGYKIIENFNKPFFQKNIALFWRSWHISVYSWIRDYFFLPLFGWRASAVKIYLGAFLTMVVFMLWHKGNINFLILGIYHGLGLVAWGIFQEAKRKYPLVRQAVQKDYLNAVSIFLTFNFVSFGFIFFSLDINTINNILSKLLQI